MKLKVHYLMITSVTILLLHNTKTQIVVESLSLSLLIAVSWCENISLPRRMLGECVRCHVHVQNLSFVLSTAYVPPIAEEEFGDFILSQDEIRLYSVANKLSGFIFVGDINERNSFQGDTQNNNCSGFLEAYTEEADALILNNDKSTYTRH